MKRSKGFAALLLAAAITIGFSACQSGSNTAAGSNGSNAAGSSTAGGQKKYHIGYMSATFSDAYCKKLADAFTALAPQYPDFKVDVLNGQLDAAKQLQCIDTFYNEKVDAVIAQQVGIDSSFLRFNQRGTPVIFVNILPTISNDTKNLKYYYVGSSDEQVGVLQAQSLAKVLPQNAKGGIIVVQLGQTNTIQRTKGFTETIAKLRPDVKIIENQSANDDTAKALSITQNWIQKYGSDNGLQFIVSQSAHLTAGIVQAVDQAHLQGKILVASVDCPKGTAEKWLENGETCVDIFQDATGQAKGALDMASKLLKGEKVDQYDWVPLVAVTKENAAEYSNK